MIKISYFDDGIELVKFCNQYNLKKEQIIQIVKGPILAERPWLMFWEDNVSYEKVKKAKKMLDLK